MPRGVKKGENRFKKAQEAIVSYRLERIRSIVIPRLKSLSSHVNIPSIHKYSKVVVDIYNDDLPMNEKKLGLRTVTQNPKYWEILGAVYHQYFSPTQIKVNFKDTVETNLKTHKINDLNEKVKRLEVENRALKSAFSTMPKKNSTFDNENIIDSSTRDVDNLCKLIFELIIASDGVIQVSLEEGTVKNLSNDLEDSFGILPQEVVAPYITWLKKRNQKLGDKDA